jgi:hypothetical protein
MTPTFKWHFVARFPFWSPEILRVGTFATLGSHNFVCKIQIAMKSQAKLWPSLRAFQQYVAHHLHARKSGQFLTFVAFIESFSMGLYVACHLHARKLGWFPTFVALIKSYSTVCRMPPSHKEIGLIPNFCSPHRELFDGMSHATFMQGNWVNFRLLMVRS